MRSFSPAILNELQLRRGLKAALLVWFVGRNRSDQSEETIGFWSGGDHQDFDIDNDTRTYLAAGSLLRIPAISSSVGLSVRRTVLTFSGISPEVEQAIYGYDIRNGRCQCHVAYFDPHTVELIGIERVYKGFVGGAEPKRAKKGEQSTVEVVLLSSARALTRTSPLKKSDAALTAQSPGDRLRRYTDLSGAIEGRWGEERAAAPSPTTTVVRPNHVADRPT